MRYLSFLFVFIWTASAAAAQITFPPLSGRVVDQAQILPATAVSDLDQMLAAHERATGQQIVVATVSSLQGQTIEDYGYQLGRTWGIGEKGKNTGAILLVAPNDRSVRIEVGYGLEGVLTDALSRTIIERVILPEFRAGRMPEGIIRGAAAIITALGGAPAGDLPQAAPQAEQDPGVIPPLGLIVLIIIFIFLARRRRGFLPGVILGTPTIWRGSSSGGDFFRGGGGSFGGGGASGRW